MDLHSLSAYQYDLPEELIAQRPMTPRDSSRLMIIDRSSGEIRDGVFRDILELLDKGDSLVFNDTKVIPARLHGKRESGGKTEIFLLEQQGTGEWKALAKPARKLKSGTKVHFSDSFSCVVQEVCDEGVVRIAFQDPENFERNLNLYGTMPLPHYIRRDSDKEQDAERYQTVFAQKPGAVAAPTAGLHFTEALLGDLESKGVEQSHITLHVGLGTFKPVLTDDITKHPMHSERFHITEAAAGRLNARAEGARQICVGTTCCRTLESAADDRGVIVPGNRDTDIFIYPGYKFKYVRSLLTNFHLPGSTLLMLISAFAGYELTMEAYRKAVKDRYRFYSYGDAMLIL